MKVFDTPHLRNLAVVGHGGCGKTTLVAAALFTAGATPQQGRVETGTTVTDFDEQEIQRRISISTSMALAEWPGPDRAPVKFNFADTPGHNQFQFEAASALEVVESVLLCVDAAAGVQVQTQKMWELAAARSLPVIFAITRCDHDHANLERALAGLRERFGRGVCAVQSPIGEQGGFQGMVDLVAMSSRLYPRGGNGKGRTAAIDDAYDEAARAAHEALVELIAEGDDALMEEFFDKGTIPVEHLTAGIHEAVRARRIHPVLLTAGGANLGVDALLDFLAAYAPHPGEAAAARGDASLDPVPGAAPLERRAADSAPLSLYVFKTVADPFAGRLSVF
ncbi:MAG: GTP-binding protein, partial [Terriglobales bacterium]